MRTWLVIFTIFLCPFANANSGQYHHVVCVPQIPRVADFAFTNAAYDVELLAATMYERLVNVDSDGIAKPSLAESWQVLEHGLLIRFQLRSGVQFHPVGQFRPTRTLNAEDVIFSFNRLMDSGALFAKIGGNTAKPFVFPSDNIQSIKGQGLNFEIRLKEPDFNLLESLSAQDASIVSLQYAEFLQAKESAETFINQPVGTGPFMFSAKSATHFELERFKAHWKPPSAISSVRYQSAPNALDRLSKVRQQQCDHALELEPRILERSNSIAGLVVQRAPILSVLFLALDTRQWPWSDVRARQALSLAINRERILNLLFYSVGGDFAANTLHPSLLGLRKAKKLDHDPERASELIQAVAQGETIKLVISTIDLARPHNPNPKRMAQLVAEDLRAIGLEIEVEWVPLERLTAVVFDVENPQYQSLLMGYMADVPTSASVIDTLLGCVEGVPVSMNFSRMCDPRVNDLVRRAHTEQNADTRLGLYREASQASLNKMQYVNLLHADRVDLLREDVVDIVRNANGWLDFSNGRLTGAE